ncbi:MAG: response regulator [Chitinispirillaceae bacterium]|nr:response regulator [Chitinispirillaceae bacterium]
MSRSHLPILVVEDNRTNQIVIEKMLERWGFENITLMENGVNAIEILSEKRFAVVLMDIQMPEMDGYTATGIIRDPSSGVLDHQVPVIAMTAHATERDRKRCLDAGMNDYLSKPVNPVDFLDKMQKWSAELPAFARIMTEEALEDIALKLPDSTVCYDPAELLANIGNDRATFRTVNEIFLSDTTSQLLKLKELIDGGQYSEAAYLAHQIKGAANAVGGGEFAAICAKIELAAAAEDRTLAIDLFEWSSASFDRLQTAIALKLKTGE